MSKTKVAIITGSTSGIGLEIAREMAKSGMSVVLNGIEPAAQVEGIRKELESYGGKVLYSPANMMNPSEIVDMVKMTENELGDIDIIVNNAGIQYVSPVEDFPEDKWNAIIAINLSSAFHLTKAVVPGMKARGWGRIINIASAHGLVASPFKSAYVAAKHGIVGFTKAVALELATSGVTVNAICPGYVLTALVEKQIPDTAKARGITQEEVIRDVLLAAQPTKRFVKTQELAGLALFLCSDMAASMTGTALPVDGGWVAH